MKKILALSLALGASLVFARDIEGIVESIDAGAKSITVSGNTIIVKPNTKIKYDGCKGERDSYKKFADIQVDDFVDVDVTTSKGALIAKSIEIQCRQ